MILNKSGKSAGQVDSSGEEYPYNCGLKYKYSHVAQRAQKKQYLPNPLISLP